LTSKISVKRMHLFESAMGIAGARYLLLSFVLILSSCSLQRRRRPPQLPLLLLLSLQLLAVAPTRCGEERYARCGAVWCIDRGGSKQQANRKKPSVSQKTRKIRRVPHRTGARRALARSEHYFTIFPFLAEQVAVQRYATWLGIAPHMWGLRGALHIPAAMLPSAPQHRTPAPPRSYKVPVHSTDLASDCGAHSKSVGIAVPARLLPSLSALPLLLHRGAFLNSDCGRPRVPSACR